MLLWFIAGVVVGWLIELFIDWSFWRRNIYTTTDADSEVAALKRKVKEYEVLIEQLRLEAGQNPTKNAIATSATHKK